MHAAKLFHFVETAYAVPLSVSTLASCAGLSRRTFERRFKVATGSSPNANLQNVCIEAAKRILETENQTIDQITEAVGCGDPAAFSKLFSKICGVSPSAYRKKFSPASL